MARCLIALVTLIFVQSSLVEKPYAKGGDSCMGATADLDRQCSHFKVQGACSKQVACRWGSQSADQCVAKDGDKSLDAKCKKIMNATQCGVQVACIWRSASDEHQMISEIEAGISALAKGASESPAYVPATMQLGGPSASSTHDHKVFPVEQLATKLKVWNSHFGLPTSVTDALEVLVAVESTEYKSFHIAISGGDGAVDKVAAAGRNWGGVVALAFVRVSVTMSYTTYAYPTPQCATRTSCNFCCIPMYCGNTNVACGTMDQTILGRCGAYTNQALCNNIPESRALLPDEIAAVASNLQSVSMQSMETEGNKLKKQLLPRTRMTVDAAEVSNTSIQAVLV